jgi:hypothetical protein
MRKQLFFFVLMTSINASAATVEISSFVYIRNNQYLAELCGIVKDAESPTFVKLHVDYKGARPAVYNAVAGVDGKFCHALVTYRGEVEASLFGSSTKTKALIE